MSKSEAVLEATKVLDLSLNFSINDVNAHYKDLLFQWHPDHCTESPEECNEMTQKIIEAYNIITNYCYNYKFSLVKEDIEKMTIDDPEEFWHSKFGNDPVWGSPDKE